MAPPQFRVRVNAGGKEVVSGSFQGPPILSIVLADEDGTPLSGFVYKVTGAEINPEITGVTPPTGVIQHVLPPNVQQATLEYWSPDAPDEVDSMVVAFGEQAGGAAEDEVSEEEVTE